MAITNSLSVILVGVMIMYSATIQSSASAEELVEYSAPGCPRCICCPHPPSPPRYTVDPVKPVEISAWPIDPRVPVRPWVPIRPPFPWTTPPPPPPRIIIRPPIVCCRCCHLVPFEPLD